MENAMQNIPQKAVADKQKIATYVKDMAEIEEKEFLLRTAAKKLREKAKFIHEKESLRLSNLEYDLKRMQEKSEKIKKESENLKKRYLRDSPLQINAFDSMQPIKPARYDEWQKMRKDPPKYKWRIQPDGFISYYIVSFILCFFVLSPIMAIYTEFFPETPVGPGFVMWIGSSLILAFFIAKIRRNKALKKHNIHRWFYYIMGNIVDEYDDDVRLCREYAELQSQISSQLFKINQQKNELALENKKCELLHTQANAIIQNANTICEQKKQIYQLNIIPPDYRTFDACVMLNAIFRNDLADTMREAILIYDERVFRGDVLRGIDNIYQMLGQLAHSMKEISDRLYSINSAVNQMVEETRTISSQLYSMEKSAQDSSARITDAIQDATRQNEQYQAAILRESQATRYSMAALEHTAQQHEWYLNMRRSGQI